MTIKIQLDAYIPIGIFGGNIDRQVVQNCTTLVDLQKAVETIRSLENRTHTEKLCELLGEDDVVIVFSNYFFDVFEKVETLKKRFNRKAVYITPTAEVVPGQNPEDLNANLVDVINFLFARKKTSNILYFSVNPVWKLILPYLMRKTFPDIKIILYKYDWLTLFCPYPHRRLLQSLFRLPEEYIEYEYQVFDMILRGEVVDGLPYKDGGEDFELLQQYPGRKLYFPAVLSKSLYQPLSDAAGPHRRFVYIGKLFSPSDYITELFTDAFLFKPFQKTAEQHCSIDAYYARSSKVTVAEYEKAFAGNDEIRIIEGRPLDQLLNSIAGKYDYGYLINNYGDDYSIIKAHVENALPARIFTFMALGIPCLVSEELKFTARFVRDNNIGFSVPYQQLSSLTSLIDSADYRGFQESIGRLREIFCFEAQKERFIEFARSIIEE